MLKKSLLTLLVALTFIAGTAKAYSLEDAMADITSLKTQIVDLKSQLSAAVITTKSDSTVSTTRNPEVTPTTTKATLIFTSPKNITPNATGADVITLQTALKEAGYFTASVTGTFGAKTERAVIEFQKANNLPATGVVGNLTKSLLTNPSNPPASSQSCATTTAASWVKVLAPNGGETYTAGQQITIKWITCSLLVNNNMTIGIKNSAGVIVAVLTQSTPNDGIQTFNIPSTLQTGQYKVYVNTVYNGITYSDQSDNTFSVTAPTLSSCNPNITTPSIKVISPNGGETYTAGQQITVKWTSCNIPSSSLVDIILQNHYSPVTGGVGGANYQHNLTIGGTVNDGIEVINLTPQYFLNGPFGHYFSILVSKNPYPINNTTNDQSDNLFTINAAPTCTSSSQPSITVLSPNGGEVYAAGQQVTVTWSSCNVPATQNLFISMEMFSASPGPSYDFGFYYPNTGIAVVTFPSQSNWVNMVYGSNFKLYVGQTISPYAMDTNDSLFAITPPLPAGCTSPAGYSSTTGLPCWLITQFVDSATSNSAVVHGYLFAGAPSAIYPIVTPAPQMAGQSFVPTNGPITNNLIGLTPNTTYSVKFCASGSATHPDVCANQILFQTLP